MAYWLFKQEPDEFSYTDLEAAGSAIWDGVSNPLAQKHLRAVAVGDQVFFYHTGSEKAVVGIMEVVAGPQPDPTDAKKVVVEVKPLRRLKTPVTLAAIKADPAFADWELVRMPRLSVMPISSERWKKIQMMGK
jgi:predicted RNA-binding protein with PUA-like domain